MDLQVGVKAILRNSQNQILVLRRSDAYGDIAGQWDIPGGRIDAGSSLYENLRREIHEETGITFTDSVNVVFTQDILRPDKHVVRITYLSQNPQDYEVVLSDEATEYGWLTTEGILESGQCDEYLREVLENVKLC